MTDMHRLEPERSRSKGVPPDVIIIGGGVIAKSCALALSDHGRTVMVVAPVDSAGSSASRAAGAMLGAFAEFTRDKDDIADRAEGNLRVYSGRMWGDWFSKITDDSGPVGAVRRGTYIVANNVGSSDVENIEFIRDRADQYGERSDWLDPEDVAGLRPHRLSRPVRVLHLPDEGYIDSHVLQEVLDAAITRRSTITVVDDLVTTVDLDSGVPSVTTRSGAVYSGADLVVAAGVQSGDLCAQLELPAHSGVPRLLGGAGASMVVDTDLRFGGVLRTPNRDFACGSHLVPLARGRAYLGATNRLETTDFEHPTPSLGELHGLCHSLANEMNTGLRTARIVEQRAGYRPISADGYPIYGATAHPNVYIATGTYRNGILMAPAIGEAVAHEVCGIPQIQENRFAPLDRERLFEDRDVDATVIASVRQVISFMQEPDGNLPYDRAAELERLISFLLKSALETGDSEFAKLFADITGRYPIAEAMPILLYEVTGR